MFKKAVFSAMAWAAIIALTILLFFAMLFFTVVLFPFDRSRKTAHAQCFWWSNALVALNPYWQLKVSGLENINRDRAYIIVANHQSLADILVAYRTYMQFKWVAKASLFKVPFIGWSMTLAKHIKLSRGKFGSIKKVYREAAEWLRSGISVLFFPEGTRSETNEMGEFQNGAFKLAIKEKVPILPISISGTHDAIPKGSWLFTTKVFARLRVLPPIETSQFKSADFAHLRDLTRSVLEGA